MELLFTLWFPEIDFSNIEAETSVPYTMEEKIESDRLIDEEMADINAFLDTLIN